jgi:hypothetical protein
MWHWVAGFVFPDILSYCSAFIFKWSGRKFKWGDAKVKCSWVSLNERKWGVDKCSEVEWSVFGWSAVKFLVTGCLLLLEYIQIIWSLLLIWLLPLSHSFTFFRYHFLSVYMCVYVYIYDCMFFMFLFNFVDYVFLLLYIFCSVYSVSLCCSVYCLCANAYCSTANKCKPNCS